MQQLKVDKTPLYLQTRQHLLGLVVDGTFQPGERLPAEIDLAAQLGISRPTLREALLNLEQEGVVVRKHGVGTFVASMPISRLESGLERLESVRALAARQGMMVHVRDLHVEQVVADEDLAERLCVPLSTPLTCVQRTIVVKQRPAAYLVDYSPVTILPPAVLGPSFNGSVLDLFKQRDDIHLREALAEITAINADARLAEQLAVETGRALLLLTETLFADDNSPVGFSHNYFLPDLFHFHVLRR